MTEVVKRTEPPWKMVRSPLISRKRKNRSRDQRWQDSRVQRVHGRKPEETPETETKTPDEFSQRLTALESSLSEIKTMLSSKRKRHLLQLVRWGANRKQMHKNAAF